MAIIEAPVADEPDGSQIEIPVDELVKLCAVDSELYCQTFFPKTFRQKSPQFAREIWNGLEHPDVRLLNLLCFRGSAKTTRLRTFASKRIAYGISRTILYIGASEADAIRSVQWLRTQVERNTFWCGTFGLRPGRKWEERQIEIIQRIPTTDGRFDEHTIWILGAGITGSLRGINFDDYRPDLIIVDDPQTDETAATQEQREKLIDLILGAVRNSLAPVVDEPNAKLVMSATPQHKDDVTQVALRDEQWLSLVFPCWTHETLDEEVDRQISAWPDRVPTEDLRAEKRAAIRLNRLSIFAKEKECRLISKETATFMAPWLNVREQGIAPPLGLRTVLAIDPVPPPSTREISKGFQKKDWEVHHVWGQSGENYHLCESQTSRGHEPSWSVATAFGLARKWRVSMIVVESIAYQRVLKWLLEQEMKRRRIYYTVIPFVDTRSKFTRIETSVGSLAGHGKLWVGLEHSRFIEQFESFGPTYNGPDDELDAAAIALSELSNPFLERLDSNGEIDNSDVEEFKYAGACP